MTEIETATKLETSLTAEQVSSYLREHPDFFHEHEALLEYLHVPHPSGKAVSLISRQLEIFRNKHQKLETQLATLIEIARENDSAFNRMHELTLAILETRSLDEVMRNLEGVLTDCFSTDYVSIKIIRPAADVGKHTLFVDENSAELKQFHSILNRNQPQCGHITLAQARFLFARQAEFVKSCAIVPMMFTQLEGMLAIGSRDEKRFHASMGHLFLTQMSEIIGTRLITLLTEI